MNIKDSYELIFPKESGFQKSQIYFYNQKINLSDLFYNNSLETKAQKNRIFVTDDNISKLDALQTFISSFTHKSENIYCKDKDLLVILKAGEKYKTIENVLAIIKAALDANFTRNCIFTAIGGGVICDMTGFAASIFKRGVDVEFVPTTLLAMVDASIGGKTGCDFDGYKNMIGSFYPASNIYYFTDFVNSQSEREYKSGLAEAIKTALLFNKDLYTTFYTESEKILSRSPEIIYKIIKECVKAKCDIVRTDFKEKNERAYLNLGHTFGHAFESIAGLGDITHGEGVAWGIGRAAELSYITGLCSKEYKQNILDLLSKYGYDINPVPKALKQDSTQLLLQAMHKDKKNQSSNIIRFTLQKDYCSTTLKEIEDNIIVNVLK